MAIDRKLSHFLGIDPAYGEPIQGQRYAVGQEFKPHTDYFDPKGSDFATYCATAGNRSWTLMVYLNQPEAGGATRFRSEEHTSELQSLMRTSYAVLCLKKNNQHETTT